MRRILVLTAVLGVMVLSACGGATATPTATVSPPTAPPAATATPAPATTPPTAPQATEPAATEPAATEPAASLPEATEPAATEPEATAPAATEPEASEPAAVDLCSLLTTAEVSAALKETVMDGSPDVGSCTWVPGDASGTATLLVETDTVDDFNSIRTLTGGGVYVITTVSGIGDDAYLDTVAGTTVITLYIRKGDQAIQVNVVSDSWSADDLTAADEALGTLAVAGL